MAVDRVEERLRSVASALGEAGIDYDFRSRYASVCA